MNFESAREGPVTSRLLAELCKNLRKDDWELVHWEWEKFGKSAEGEGRSQTSIYVGP